MTHYTMGLHDRGGEQIRLLHPLPGARVTQGYGPSTIAYPNWDGHAGVDYSAVVGTPVRAAHDGRCYPGDQGAAGWGRYVTIRALDGACETIYAHLSTVLVNYRDRVAAGQIIGGTGNTGRSTGPHLHFGLRPLPADYGNGYGGWVDPEPYFVEEAVKTTLHVQRHEDWQNAVCRDLGAAWVKVVNPPQDRVLYPDVPYVLVRYWTDDLDGAYIRDGREGGARFVRDMLPRWLRVPDGYAYELANEPECNTNEGLANLREYSIGAMEEAERHAVRLCILNLPEGNPHDNDTGDDDVVRWKWGQLAAAVQRAVAGGHYVGMHAYWRPGVEGPDGRYHALGRRAWDIDVLADHGVDVDRLKVLVNECGIDGGIAPNAPGHAPGRGWRALSNADAYRADLVAMERYARTVPQIQACMVFTAGYEPPWETFDVDEGFARGLVGPLRAVNGESGPPVAQPPTAQPEEETVSERLSADVAATALRWHCEEATREVERGEHAAALARLKALVDRERGLAYRVEDTVHAMVETLRGV